MSASNISVLNIGAAPNSWKCTANALVEAIHKYDRDK